MTDAKPPIFVDSNVLIRATFDQAEFHDVTSAALTRLRAAGHRLWISRQVVREFIAYASRSQDFMRPMPAEKIIESVRYFEARFDIGYETAFVAEKLLDLLRAIPFGGKQVHDANIVATMLVYNVPALLTLNTADFERFGSLIDVLTPQAALERLTPEA